jgi:hypothetical protein
MDQKVIQVGQQLLKSGFCGRSPWLPENIRRVSERDALENACQGADSCLGNIGEVGNAHFAGAMKHGFRLSVFAALTFYLSNESGQSLLI